MSLSESLRVISRKTIIQEEGNTTKAYDCDGNLRWIIKFIKVDDKEIAKLVHHHLSPS